MIPARVEIGFGTDLLGPLHEEQSGESLICYDEGEGEPPGEIIRSATRINAKILQREGQLGELVPRACADLLVVGGDPLKDLKLLQDQGAHLAAIMRGAHSPRTASPPEFAAAVDGEQRGRQSRR